MTIIKIWALLNMAILAIVLAGPGRAQQAAPPVAASVDLTLSATDQSDILVVCVLALRSPQLGDTNAVISLGEFCVRLRNLINDAQRKALAPQPKKD